nr:hypothetical protein [Sphingobacterium sp. E70]
MNDNSTKSIWKVIGASSMGTLIEWYDFFIFGSLSIVISTKFFLQTTRQQLFYLHWPLLPLDLSYALLARYFWSIR